MIPLILLVGQGGSGKDTVANFLVQNHGAIAIAQADPLKRFAKNVFEFTDQQLWGPSNCRNAIDTRSMDKSYLDASLRRFRWYAGKWIEDVVHSTEEENLKVFYSLVLWFENVQSHSIEYGITPRYALQTLGTEWGRAFKKELWVDYASRIAVSLLKGGYSYSASIGLINEPNSPPAPMVVITDGRFINEVMAISQCAGNVWRIKCPQADGSEAELAGVKGHASEQEQKTIPDSLFNVIINNDKNEGLAALSHKVTAAALSLNSAKIF